MKKSKILGDLNQKKENIIQNGELINTKTLFPSDIKEYKNSIYQEGGLMLLKINPKSLEKNCVININIEYIEIEGNKFEKNFEIVFTPDELKNGFESNEIKKGIVVIIIINFIEKWQGF